ncbi:hypothetical protein OPAG_07937 [Rhodococcus opacus PD630]|nr:hypothetical protein OPAG_07937 [Rhodococcus opacus PD630]
MRDNDLSRVVQRPYREALDRLRAGGRGIATDSPDDLESGEPCTARWIRMS